jgi:hypothetical protein
MVQALLSVDVDWSAANVLLGKMPNSRKLKRQLNTKSEGMSVITNDIFQKNKGIICFRYVKENNRI